MSENEYLQFRKDFQSIVGLRGETRKHENIVKMYTRYDKNGSHKKWIDSSLDNLKGAREKLKAALLKYDLSYDELLKESRKLSNIVYKLKSAVHNKPFWEAKFRDYVFPERMVSSSIYADTLRNRKY